MQLAGSKQANIDFLLFRPWEGKESAAQRCVAHVVTPQYPSAARRLRAGAADHDPMLPLIRESARKGVPHAQQALVEKLKSLGRMEEARREARIYRVSEEARPRPASEEDVAVITMGTLGHLKDSRLQAVVLGALAMLVLVRRARRNSQLAGAS